MAVIPDVSCIEGAVMTNGILKVPIFLVRVDGVIYHTGIYYSGTSLYQDTLSIRIALN